MKIKTIFFERFDKKKWIEKYYNVNTVYVYVTDRKEEDLFTGEIFRKTVRGVQKFHNVNPVDIKIHSDFADDMVDVYMTNNGDGLLVDHRYHSVLNGLESPTAEDIVLFVLDMKKEEWM